MNSRISFLCVTIPLLLLSAAVQAQTVNWSLAPLSTRHLIHVRTGVDFGWVSGIGYGYQLTSTRPTLFTTEFSQPVGRHPFDDFKFTTGVQSSLYRHGNFHLFAKAVALVRRFENPYARLLNVGTELSTGVGYYRSTWFAAVDGALDKAILTHFKHSPSFLENFPEVHNGWYEPPTGGHVSFGIQLGFTHRQADWSLRTGKIVQQDFRTKPGIPFYFQLGYLHRIKHRI